MTPPDSPAVDAVVERLVSFLVEGSEGRLTAADIDPGQHMYDCGYLDSLSAAAFLKNVEQAYGVRLKESQLIGALETVRAVAAHIEAGG